MPSAILNNPNWLRSIEKLLGCKEYTMQPLDPARTALGAPVYPGMVMHLVNGQFELADTALDGGKFFGLMYSEVSAAIDELQGGTIAPVVLHGPGTVTVMNLNSAGGANLGAGPWMLGAGAVDLVAVGGLLTVRPGGNTSPAVGTLNAVYSDRIEIQLAAPAV